MLILASTFNGLPIISLAEERKVAEIQDIIIEPKNGELLGFELKKNLFSPPLFLASSDIEEVTKEAVFIRQNDSVVEKEEIPRLAEALQKKIKFKNLKVITESQKTVGRLEDLLIDLPSKLTLKYYVKGLFKSRIIPKELVVKITPKAMVVQDEVLDGKIELAGEATA